MMKNFKNIPQERLIAYLLILGIVPLFLVGLHFVAKKNEISALSDKLTELSLDVMQQNKKELSNRSVRAQFQNKDQFYLIKELESMQLMKEDVAAFKKILDSGYHQEEEQIR